MDEQNFRLLLGVAGVAFGAIQLYFRSELKAVALLREQVNKLELRFDTYKESIKNLFQTHVGWVQKEVNRLNEKCETHRKEQATERARIDGNTQIDAKEIIKQTGEIKLLKTHVEAMQQFFYENKSLWESKADIIDRIEKLEFNLEILDKNMSSLQENSEKESP